MAEAPGNQGESCVSLEDVCLRFTAEEWGLLDDAQKLLYHNVMLENFSLVLSLGLPISKSFPGGLGLPFSIGYFPVTVIKHLDQGHLKKEELVMGLPCSSDITIRVEKLGSRQPWQEEQPGAHILNHKKQREQTGNGTRVYPSWPYLLQKDKHMTVEPSINI